MTTYRRGDAKRRRALPPADRSAAGWAWLEELAAEDPDDRADREAHGFTADDDWQDPTVVCRRGCGLAYGDVVAGKIRHCRADSLG